MPPAAILFDLDGTLVDDAHAVGAALRLLHARYGEALGLSFEDLGLRWTGLMNVHFTRYLAGEISFQEQRRAGSWICSSPRRSL
jgi:beta-phosphoglucomutase-like phosphatase (HAD superfamily)